MRTDLEQWAQQIGRDIGQTIAAAQRADGSTDCTELDDFVACLEWNVRQAWLTQMAKETRRKGADA